MTDIKLCKLPDRTPIKIQVSISPELHRMLGDYAAFYAEIYGRDEPVSELVPAMLLAFLQSDRAFTRRQPKP